MSLPKVYRELLKPKSINTRVSKILKEYNIHTVCDEALCPNRGECYSNGTATFLVMGNICTRNCTFCAITKGKPEALDYKEIDDLIDSIKKMSLKYVVITSVTRDDLLDGGVGFYNEMLEKIRREIPNIKIEILVPDFNKNPENIKKLNKKNFDVFNHNLETIKELYREVRPMADYQVSLNILKEAKALGCITKTGIMVGLGETKEQLKYLFNDISKTNVDILTIGQYIRPSKKHHDVKKYYLQNEFDELKDFAQKAGIKHVVSGIFVRSSYNAFKVYKEI